MAHLTWRRGTRRTDRGNPPEDLGSPGTRNVLAFAAIRPARVSLSLLPRKGVFPNARYARRLFYPFIFTPLNPTPRGRQHDFSKKISLSLHRGGGIPKGIPNRLNLDAIIGPPERKVDNGPGHLSSNAASVFFSFSDKRRFLSISRDRARSAGTRPFPTIARHHADP